jgi:hypothetical protein
MDSEALLQTHAEVAVALAGFASVVAALRRPLSPFARQRFLSLLALAMIQILGCLLPLWSVSIFPSTATAWRTLSAVLLGLSAARMWWLVVLPSRALGQGTLAILNPLASRLIWGAGLVALLLLVLNVVGFPASPSFNVYYAALLATLMVGFALFADVAVSDA